MQFFTLRKVFGLQALQFVAIEIGQEIVSNQARQRQKENRRSRDNTFNHVQSDAETTDLVRTFRDNKYGKTFIGQHPTSQKTYIYWIMLLINKGLTSSLSRLNGKIPKTDQDQTAVNHFPETG